MTNRPRMTRRAVAALAACALIVAACGGDDDDADDTAAATADSGDDAATEDSGDDMATEDSGDDMATEDSGDDMATEDSGDDMATEDSGDDTASADTGDTGSDVASDRVDFFLQPTTELPFNEPVAMESGKKLFYVKCGVPVCEEIGVGIESAAAAAGWTVETTSHQDTPDTVASAFDTAIAAQPDVVMTSGNPREWFADQLATLQEQGIPIVSWSIPEGYEPGDGINVNLLTNDDYYFYGVLMADYAAVNSTTQNILFVGLPNFPVLSTVQEGFTAEIAEVCPDCSVETMEVAVTDLGTNLPGMVVSQLQTNPDIDMVIYAFGGMLFGVPEAIEAAGLGDQAVAISQAGGPLNFGYITSGQHQVAEVALASELLGWRAVDAAARIFAGDGPGFAAAPPLALIEGHPDILASGLPLQILEAESIDDPAALWVGVEGFQDQFLALWGL